MKRFLRGRSWIWLFVLAGAGLGYSAEPAKPAEKAPHVRGFEKLIEAESFKGVAEPVKDEKGVEKAEPGRWTRYPGASYSKGANIAGPGEDVTSSFQVPADGMYYFWVYHSQHPSLWTSFSLFVYQGAGKAARLEYSPKFASEKRDYKDLIYRPGYWDVWSVQPLALKKGNAKLTLAAAEQPSWRSTVDVIFITDDPDYKPALQPDGLWDTFFMDDQ